MGEGRQRHLNGAMIDGNQRKSQGNLAEHQSEMGFLLVA